MSFSIVEVFQEFAEAARLGRTSRFEHALAERTSRRLRQLADAKADRNAAASATRVTYPITPLPVQAGVCERCGSRTELREGATRPLHIAKQCRKEAA